MIYRGLGFPIRMTNVPMIKVHGEWAMDISFKKLMLAVLEDLLKKPTLLNGSEMKFIRKYLELTTTEFGKLLGVSHAAVVKWENETNQQSLSTDVFIRLLVTDRMKRSPKIFRDTFNIARKTIMEGEDQAEPIEIDALQIA